MGKQLADAGRRFYEQFERHKLTEQTLDQLMEWSDSQLWSLLQDCLDTIPTDTTSPGSMFEFVANDQLSGMPAPCAGEWCRLGSGRDLARFAAPYADRVVVRHPFESYVPHAIQTFDEHGNLREHSAPTKREWDPHKRRRLITDIKIAMQFKPLAIAGIASFTSVRNQFCPMCIYETLRQGKGKTFMPPGLTEQWQRRLGRMVRYLLDAFKQRSTATLRKSQHGYEVVLTAEDGLIEHGEQRHTVTPPARLKKRLESGDVKLSFQQLRNTRLINGYIERIIDDIACIEYHAKASRCNYLTSRTIDLELISETDKPTKMANRNMVKTLSHELPFVAGLSIAELVKIRKAEQDAFVVYRDAVSQVLRKSAGLGYKELAEALNDEIRPEVNKISRVLGNLKRLNAKSIAQDVVITAGLVAIGVFSGILPDELRTLVAAIGGLNTVKSIGTKLPEVWRTPKEALDNRYYFLWKAQNAVR